MLLRLITKCGDCRITLSIRTSAPFLPLQRDIGKLLSSSRSLSLVLILFSITILADLQLITPGQNGENQDWDSIWLLSVNGFLRNSQVSLVCFRYIHLFSSLLCQRNYIFFASKRRQIVSDEEMLPFLDSSIIGFQLCSPKIVGLLVINTITSVISNHLAQFVGAMFYDGSLPFYNRKLWNCLFFFLYSSSSCLCIYQKNPTKTIFIQ